MRTNSTLEDYQRVSPKKPNVGVYYYTSSWQDISADIDEVELNIEPYNSEAVVVIENRDGTYDSTDFRDKAVRIDWGYADEVSTNPYVWVYAQTTRSSPREDGRMKTCIILFCEGAWNRLRRWVADDDYYYNQPDLDATRDSYTIKDIINEVCENAGTDLGTSRSEDTKIDSWEPVCTIKKNENGANVVKALLKFTKCRLVPDGDDLDIKYPKDTDGVDYHYYIEQA